MARNVRIVTGSRDELERQQQLADALTVRSLKSRVPQQGGPVQVKMSPWEGVAQLGEALIAARMNKGLGERAAKMEADQREANTGMVHELTKTEAPRRLDPQGQPMGAPVEMPTDLENKPFLNSKGEMLTAAMRGMDPRQAGNALGGAMMQRAFAPAPELEKIEAGDRILLTEKGSGRVVSEIPMGASPNAVLGEQGAMARHAAPSGNARLGADVSLRGQDIGASTARRGQDVTMRGQDLSYDASLRGQDMSAETARITSDPNRQATIDQASRNAKQKSGALGALDIINSADVLISQSTGSYLGAGIDAVARAFGGATDGAIAVGKLKTLQAALMLKLPRMEGPQSNYDVQLYKEAAGQIGDPTVPNAQKVASLDTIRELQEKYAGMAPGASRPNVPKFASEAEAEAAGIAPNTKVVIGGVLGTWQ